MSFVAPALDLQVRDFSAGFLDSPENDTLPPGASPDAKNAFFAKVQAAPRRVSLQKRPGSRLTNATPMTAETRIDGLCEFTRPGAAPELIAVCNGTAYKLDGAGYTALTGGTGFTAGNPVRFLIYRNQLYLTDGVQQRRYNGTACFPIGFAAPSSVTAMTAVAPTGAGVTGTFETVYTWYDNATDHESSPSVATAALVTAAQARRHTKPGGSPPSNVTHWRAYVRRTDTYEASHYRAATVPIATATFDEEQSDTARVDRAPAPNEHDVPPVFAAFATYAGYVFGFKADDFSLYVSKQGNGEAWHPRNVFPIRGGGRELRQIRSFGTELLVRTLRRTFHLVGTRIPFEIEELNADYGAVSQESGVEVGGRYFDWDDQHGPYWTDTVAWRPIGDNRIEAFLATVNRAQLAKVRAELHPEHNLVCWIVPTGTQSRCRTILAYDYELEAWLPPITGLEYNALTRYTPTDGRTGLYMGDWWGRVYELFSGTRDGPPSGTVRTTVTSATASTVTCSGAAFYTTGAGLAGMPVCILSPAGVQQWRRIKSNTATVLTLDVVNDAAWTTVPAADWTVLVGGLEWYWTTPWLDAGEPGIKKRGGHLVIQGRAAEGVSTTLDVRARYNDIDSTADTKTYTYDASEAGAIWGAAIWGVDYWGAGSGGTRKIRKARIGRSFYSAQFRMANPYPDEPFTLVSYQVTADRLPRTRVRNA